VRFWEPVLRRFPALTRSQVRVIQGVVEFPQLKTVDLARVLGLSEATIDRVKGSEIFGQVLLAYALSRGDLFTAKNLLLLDEIQQRLVEKIYQRGGLPTEDEQRVLELLLKRSGLLQNGPAVAVQVNASGGAEVKIGAEIAALAESVVADPVEENLEGHSAECDGEDETDGKPRETSNAAVSTPLVLVAPGGGK
jgi:hypothetical protein